MITAIKTQKMVILSDLHVGNPFSQVRRSAIRFLKWAAREGYDICINGDGLEIAQASFGKIATEIPDFIRTLRDLKSDGRSVYYVVGNHVIALEHFLEDWGALKVSPFLNVYSGTQRIRIEHGHLYDPFFVRSPRLYELGTKLGGLLLAIHPGLYRVWIRFEEIRARLRARRTGILGEPSQFSEAAHELTERGFDAVIFGHTHHPGEIVLPNGKKYFNPGSWMLSRIFIEIANGTVRMRDWDEAIGVPKIQTSDAQ